MTMTTEEALLELGGSTADAVLRVLLSIAPDAAEKGAVAVVPSSGTPMQALAFPAVAANVSYVDGVTGGNVFVITRLGARKLAATMMMQEPPTEDHDGELDEIELSAVGEAMNQMMAAAAGATGKVLGQEVEISVPTTRMFEKAAAAEGAYPKTPHATMAAFTVLGEPCRLIQLVPNAFVVRMTRALADRNAEHRAGDASDGEPILSAESIRDIRVRVGVELGRTTLPLAKAVGLGAGAVVELDRAPNDPIDLYVNGRRFATGRLLLIDQTEWAVHIEHVLDPEAAYATSHEGGF
jgi:flagellar motor switch protein FliN/FliY